MAPTSGEAQVKRGEKATQARGSKKLSGERLARKRELDRQAQHDTRRKSKNYIMHLESLVESLKTNNSDPWIAQIEEKRKFNEQLATTLRSIGRMAEATLRIADLEPPPTKTNTNEESNATEDGVSLEQSEEMIDGLQTMNNEPTTTHYFDSQNEMPQSSPSDVEVLPNLFPSLAEQRRQSIENALPKNMPVSRIHHQCGLSWLSTKQVMLQCKTIQNHPIIHEATDTEIPVQAIILGWDTVERIYTLNPLWQILRQTDKGIFFTCTPSHRLAVMVLMHMEMKYIIDPSYENLIALPDFMRPRPCQKLVEHPIAIDFFPWPGLREHLIFYEHDFCTNTFSRAFHENYNFRWPFEFRDTYVKNQDTGLLELSRTFQEKLYDLQSWTIDSPFFDLFPQLRGDIPMSTTVSNPLASTFSAQRPSIPTSNYISNQIPTHSWQDPSSQRQGTFDDGDSGIPITSMSHQTLMNQSAGLLWVEALQ